MFCEFVIDQTIIGIQKQFFNKWSWMAKSKSIYTIYAIDATFLVNLEDEQ